MQSTGDEESGGKKNYCNRSSTIHWRDSECESCERRQRCLTILLWVSNSLSSGTHIKISELNQTFPALYVRNGCVLSEYFIRSHNIVNCLHTARWQTMVIKETFSHLLLPPSATFGMNSLPSNEREKREKNCSFCGINEKNRPDEFVWTVITHCYIVCDCNIFESKSKMTNMSLWTMFWKVHTLQRDAPFVVECNRSAADVKLIRFGIMLAGRRMFSIRLWRLWSQFQSITFFFFLRRRRIFWMLVGSHDDRKYEHSTCLILFSVILFYLFLLLGVIYEQCHFLHLWDSHSHRISKTCNSFTTKNRKKMKMCQTISQLTIRYMSVYTGPNDS